MQCLMLCYITSTVVLIGKQGCEFVTIAVIQCMQCVANYMLVVACIAGVVVLYVISEGGTHYSQIRACKSNISAQLVSLYQYVPVGNVKMAKVICFACSRRWQNHKGVYETLMKFRVIKMF